MQQLNRQQLETLLNACEMARAEYINKIQTLPFFTRRQEPTYAEYQRHKNFPYKNENELRWEKAIDKLNELICLIKSELKHCP